MKQKQTPTPKRYAGFVFTLLVVATAYLQFVVPLPSQSQPQWQQTTSDGSGRKDGTKVNLAEGTVANGIQGMKNASVLSSMQHKSPTTSVVTQPETTIPTSHPMTSTHATIPRQSLPRAVNVQVAEEHQYADKATIVVALSGELANNLMHIAHAVGLQHMARDLHSIECNIVLRRPVGPMADNVPNPKWKLARQDIQQCFPKLANWDFEEGNTAHYEEQSKKQHKWLGKDASNYLVGHVNAMDQRKVEIGLEYLVQQLKNPQRPKPENDDASKGTIRVPYMLSQSLEPFPFIDKYYEHIRELFEFDDTKCCNRLAHPGEYIFHFRNFKSELPPEMAYRVGYTEISPPKMAKEVFGKLQPSDKVAVVSRFGNQASQEYVDALKAQGKSAYLVEGQTGVEDFCFLKEAPVELVGNARSTFVFCAAILGKVPKVRLYHVDNWGLRKILPNFFQHFTFNFTHPELKNRIQYELYRAEEMEESNHTDGKAP